MNEIDKIEKFVDEILAICKPECYNHKEIVQECYDELFEIAHKLNCYIMRNVDEG